MPNSIQMRLVLILILAAVATSNAYIIVNTYSDASCSEASLMAVQITYDSDFCSVQGTYPGGCNSNDLLPGVTFSIDYRNCGNSSVVYSFTDGWQYVVAGFSDNYCNFSKYGIWGGFGAAKSLDNTPVAVLGSTQNGSVGPTTENVTLICNSTGVISFAVCVTLNSVNQCQAYEVENGVCAFQSPTGVFQQTCSIVPPVAPVAEPIAEPVQEPSSNTSEPINSPYSPVAVPTKVPTAKTSASSFLFRSLACLSLVILI